MLFSIPDKIATIPNPAIREVLSDIYKALEPSLSVMENNMVDSLKAMGGGEVEQEALRNMMRTETFQAMLEKLKEQVDAHMAKRESTQGEKP